MAKAIGIGVEEVAGIGLVLGAGYLLWTGQMPDIVDKIKEFLDSIGASLPSLGGPISSGTCTGTPLKRANRSDRVQYGTDNIPGNPQSYEVTWCGTIGSQGEDLTFKLYGPSHSNDGDCCWCVMHVDKSGKMTPGGEGPHPHSNCEHGGGGSAGVAPCYRAVIRPGPVQEGYALVGGQWKKVAEYRGPCGCSKKSSSKTGNTLMVRCDGSLTTKCVSVNALGGGGVSPSSAARAARIVLPHETNQGYY